MYTQKDKYHHRLVIHGMGENVESSKFLGFLVGYPNLEN